MARKKKNNRSNERRDPVSAKNSRVIKAGIYDGSQSSDDFVVSGHSTGAVNTEMEALSHQVSIDAGRVPDYPTDDNFNIQKTSTDIGQEMPEDFRDTKDLGGPDLYGPAPTLLEGDSPLNEPASADLPSPIEAARSHMVAPAGAAMSTAGSDSGSSETASAGSETAGISDALTSATDKLGISETLSNASEKIGIPKVLSAASEKVSMPNAFNAQGGKSAWYSLGILGSALLGWAAYKLYKDPELRKSFVPTT